MLAITKSYFRLKNLCFLEKCEIIVWNKCRTFDLESGVFVGSGKEKEKFKSPGPTISNMKKAFRISILKTYKNCFLHYFFLFFFNVFWYLFFITEMVELDSPTLTYCGNEEKQKQVFSFMGVSELSMFMDVRMLWMIITKILITE